MSSQAKVGKGTLLKLGDGAGPEVFTAIAEMDAIDPFEEVMGTVEVTHQTSLNNAKEFIAEGFVDPGEVTAEGNYIIDTAHTSLRTDLYNGTLRNFQLVIPLATPETWAFSAYVTSVKRTTPKTNPMRFAIKLKVSGKPTVTP